MSTKTRSASPADKPILSASASASADAHALLRQSGEWIRAERACREAYEGFVLALRCARLQSMRWEAYEEALQMRFIDDLIETAIASLTLMLDGAHNPVRRELRYVLEAAINHLFVDQFMPNAPLATRLAYVRRERMIDTMNAAGKVAVNVEVAAAGLFKATVVPLYSATSQYVHPSAQSLQARLERAGRGAYIGFESVQDLREVTDLAVRVYDVALCCVFTGLGPGLTGDLLLGTFEDMVWWPYHYTPLMASMSRVYNYKFERSQPGAGPVGNRVQELIALIESYRRTL